MNEISLKTVYEALDKPSYRIPFNIAQDLFLVMQRVNFADDDARLELTEGAEIGLGFIRGPRNLADFVRPEVRKTVKQCLSETLSSTSAVARDTMIAKAAIAGQEDQVIAELYALKAGVPLGITGMISRPSVSEDELMVYYEQMGLKQLGWYLLDSFTTTSVENIDQFARHITISDDVKSLRDFYAMLQITAHKTFASTHLAAIRISNILAPESDALGPDSEKKYLE